MPQSMLDLPTVKSSLHDFEHFSAVVFEEGTIAFNGRGVSLGDTGIETAVEGQARTRSSRRGKSSGRRLAASDCPDNGYFCLFTCEDQFNGSGGCYKWLKLSSGTWQPRGWENLAQFGDGYNNEIRSMINNRSKDSGLARYPDGNGYRYCAGSFTEDDDLVGNFGDNLPSSFKLYDDDNHCT